MTSGGIRPAFMADVPAVKAVTDAAYAPCIERIGVVPQPTEADRIYPRYGYQAVERRADGPYDRVHYRTRLG